MQQYQTNRPRCGLTFDVRVRHIRYGDQPRTAKRKQGIEICTNHVSGLVGEPVSCLGNGIAHRPVRCLSGPRPPNWSFIPKWKISPENGVVLANRGIAFLSMRLVRKGYCNVWTRKERAIERERERARGERETVGGSGR